MNSVQDTLQAGWVSPFGNSRIKACLTAPRDLSQSTTSFIASSCQGIHHARLFTWPYNLKLLKTAIKARCYTEQLIFNSPCLLLLQLSSRTDAGHLTIANKHTYTNYALVQYFFISYLHWILITKIQLHKKLIFDFFKLLKNISPGQLPGREF